MTDPFIVFKASVPLGYWRIGGDSNTGFYFAMFKKPSVWERWWTARLLGWKWCEVGSI